ncbi:hypothetical protein AWB67_06793 [Caballeronia terrestris]|uniref:Uncharacterized protein n=1 Tax=Caballeronia terrestris TaxID=1226301 RepID=A0A158KUV5_9BURK|nr:hypothetical protein [Caballeronia terrestris]SAL84884.1 hypothetical protein AWB67_06793 [Caballeronia terrestris]
MKKIAISTETYAQMVRAGQLTHQDAEAWADAILACTVSEVIRVMQKQDEARRGHTPTCDG